MAEAVRTRENIRMSPTKKSSRKLLVAAAVVIPLVITGITGSVAGWMYLSSQQTRSDLVSTDNDGLTTDQPETASQITHAPPEVIKASDTVPASHTPDNEAIKSEIANLIEKWKDLTEGRNAEKLVQMYGEKVDYHGTEGTTVEQIKSELNKTFDAFSDIDIEISNLIIAVDAEGATATALFDKEWSHEAPPKLAEGKAHFKMHLQRTGSDWKIVTEKQLKVYFLQN